MRVLLDECLPRGLRRSLPGHVVRTVQQEGWAGLVNGALLVRIEGAFDAFITMDRGLAAQNVLRGRSFGTVVLRARSNRMADVVPLAPAALDALRALQPGDLRVVGDAG